MHVSMNTAEEISALDRAILLVLAGAHPDSQAASVAQPVEEPAEPEVKPTRRAAKKTAAAPDPEPVEEPADEPVDDPEPEPAVESEKTPMQRAVDIASELINARRGGEVKAALEAQGVKRVSELKTAKALQAFLDTFADED